MYTNGSQLIYNGFDLSKYIFVDGITKYVSPKLKFQQANISVGSYVQGYGYEPFVIRVNASILANKPHEIAQARRIIAQALMSFTPEKLLLPDDTGIYYKALYIGGSEVGAFTQAPDITLEFLIPDPIAYGGHHEERVQTHKDGTTEDIMLVGGTYPTKPKITIACEPNYYPMEIANKTTEKKICFVEDFKSNQVVTIDCELERVSVSTVAPNPNGGEMLKANTHDIPLFLESDFFDIKDNDILYHSPTISAYTIEWDERFL
ncbi:distal tail protein Dit [Fannyhessea vaginae]|uniref:distal tail protein Dit n=1 Tax=Fannyhessea vaginae TaxID=82135 RepID=UPI00288AE592|nr:distal tail protein Dit [Fannyhessea vaginae]